MSGALGVGTELEHPPRHVFCSRDDSILAALAGLTNIHQYGIARPGQLFRDGVRCEVLDLPSRRCDQLTG